MNTNWLTKIVLSDRTQHLSTKYSIPIEEVKDLLQYDPTKGRYLEWITKNYKSNQLRFPEDGNKTIETLTTFTKLHPVLRRNNVSIDINLYSYSDLVRLIEQYGEQKSKREQYRINEVEGVKELLDFPPYKAVQVLTPEASAKLCRDTEWCVKDPRFFNRYSDNLIMVLKDGKPYYLVHEKSGQYKDIYDEGLLTDQHKDTEALNVLKKLYDSGLVKEPVGEDFGGAILRLLPQDQIIKSARFSYHYAKDILWERFELGEPTIAQDAQISFEYALNVIDGRFELGEPSIAKDADLSYGYAIEILNYNRFELGEKSIATDAICSCKYALHVIRGRFELGEEAIATDAKSSHEYALHVIGDRFELGERAIITSAEWAYRYAKDVIKGRFELGESIIATSAIYSYCYAEHVIKSRFELGEPAIATEAYYSYLYAILVIHDRFKLGEPAILDSQQSMQYLKFLRKNSIEI